MKGYSFGELVKLAEAALPKTDNAVSATKLQTARTIGGVAFDGTGNINLPGVNIAGTQNTSGRAAVASTADKLTTARNINGVAFDGTKNIDISAGAVGTYTKAEIDAKDNLKLDKAGGTLTGVVSSNSNTIFNFSRDTNLNVGLDWSEDFLRFRAGSTEMAKGIRLSSYDTPVAEIRRNGNIWASSGMLVGSNRVFHEGFLPNAGQVGTYTKAEIDTKDNAKLNLTGGTLSGTLVMGGNEIHFTGSGNAAGDLVWKNGNTQEARIWSDSPARLNISSGSSTSHTGTGVLSIDQNTLRFGGKKVYSEHEKPTADEVQAVRSLDGTNTFKSNYYYHYQSAVILLIPLSTATTGSEASRRSVSGTLSLRRGNAGAANSMDVVEVHYQSSYNDLRGTYMKLHSSRGGRIVTCLYGGVRYLAWDITSGGNAQDGDILFNGSIVGQDGNLLKTVAYKGDGTSGGTAVVTNKEVYDSLSAATAYNPMVGADGFIFHDHRPPSASQVGTYTKAEIDQKDAGKLSLTGGTMSGNITLQTGKRIIGDVVGRYLALDGTECGVRSVGNASLVADSDASSTGEFAQVRGGNNDLRVTSSAAGTSDHNLTYNGKKVFHEGLPPNAGQVGTYTKAEIDSKDNGKLNLTGGTISGQTRFALPYRAIICGSTALDSNGWPNANNSDANNYINRSRYTIEAGNNGLHFIGDGASNARRFGIQAGHSADLYANAYGTLNLNPYGGAVAVNGHEIYHKGNKPTAADVGALKSVRFGAVVKPAAWSRIFKFMSEGTLGASARVSINYTRNSVVCNAVFDIITNHSYSRQINLVSSGSYTQCKLRLTDVDANNCYVELWDLGTTAADTQGITVNVMPYHGTVEPITSYTAGGGTERAVCTSVSGGLKVNENRVYDQGFKPTAADVGALASNGTAVAATKLATPRAINGVNFDGSANITITAAANGGTSAACSGNAATATTLQTARTINGVSFNGSANITITAAANGGTSAACSGNAVTATTLQTARTIGGVSFNGSANINPHTLAVSESSSSSYYPILWESGGRVYKCASNKGRIRASDGTLDIGAIAASGMISTSAHFSGNGSGLTNIPRNAVIYRHQTLYDNVAGLNTGNFVLSAPWYNYNELVFITGSDDGVYRYSVRKLKYEIEVLQGSGKPWNICADAYNYWNGSFASDGVTFVTNKEVSRVYGVIGFY